MLAMSIVYIRPIGALFGKADERSLSVIARKKETGVYQFGNKRRKAKVCRFDISQKGADSYRFDADRRDAVHPDAGQPRNDEIVDVSLNAWKAGIFPGRPVNSLKVIYPRLEIVEYNDFEHVSRANEVRNILYKASPIVEPEGLGTFAEIPSSSAEDVIRQISLDCTPFTVIAGVAENKFLAKAAVLKIYPEVCSRRFTGTKIVTVKPDETSLFLHALPLGLVWLVPETVQMELTRSGLRTLGEVLSVPKHELLRRFGDWGACLLRLVRGEDVEPIKPAYPEQVKEAEITFPSRCPDFKQIDYALRYLAHHLEGALKACRYACGRLSLEAQWNAFKTDHFTTDHRSDTTAGCLVEEKWLKPPLFTYDDLLWSLKAMAAKVIKVPPDRLVARAYDLSVISTKQVSLLEPPLNKRTTTLLDDVISFLNRRYGRQIIRCGQDLPGDWVEEILACWDPVR